MISKKPLRVAILSAHEGAAYWLKLIEHLNIGEDFRVQSLHSFSDRRYRSKKSYIGRLLLYLQIYVVYPLKSLQYILFQQHLFDAFLVVTSPFFLPSLCTLVSRKPVIILQNDLYPEALILANLIKRSSFSEHILRLIVKFGVIKAFAVVYICQSHRLFAEKQFGTNHRTFVIPVGADGSVFTPPNQDLQNKPVTLLYCGTLGLMHDPTTLIEYLRHHVVPNGLQFNFHTSGSAKIAFDMQLKNELASQKIQNPITLGDSLTFDKWVEAMLTAQIGMVFQSVGAENVVFPSKVFSILMAGQAILAITSKSSELGILIDTYDCGWVVEQGDLKSIGKAIEEMLIPEILFRKRSNSYNLGHQQFDVKILAESWGEVLREVNSLH